MKQNIMITVLVLAAAIHCANDPGNNANNQTQEAVQNGGTNNTQTDPAQNEAPALAAADNAVYQQAAGIDNTQVSLTYNQGVFSIELQEGASILSAHAWFGNTMDTMPVNQSGRPVMGQFPYKYSGTGYNVISFTAGELNGYCGQKIYGALHMEVETPQKDGTMITTSLWLGEFLIDPTANSNSLNPPTYFSFTPCQ